MINKCLRPYNALTVLLRCMACKKWQILHQIFMVIILPHISARGFDYCLVNKIFILVFYPPSIISLVRH